MVAVDVTESEMRAAEIVYKRDHGVAVSYSQIPEEDREAILREITARVLQIEQFVAHDMLDRKVSEGRFTPRRHMIVAFAVGVIMCIVIGILLGIKWLITRQ